MTRIITPEQFRAEHRRQQAADAGTGSASAAPAPREQNVNIDADELARQTAAAMEANARTDHCTEPGPQPEQRDVFGLRWYDEDDTARILKGVHDLLADSIKGWVNPYYAASIVALCAADVLRDCRGAKLAAARLRSIADEIEAKGGAAKCWF